MTVALSLPGPFRIYFFSLVIGAAASLGLSRILQRSGQRPVPGAAGLLVLLTTLLGARAGFLTLQPGTPFFEYPLGGLSWAGAIAGGILGAWLTAGLTHFSFAEVLDLFLPLAAALTAGAWLGCWPDGCAYGPVVDAWYALPARDEWGNLAGRLPVQALGMVLALLTFSVAQLLQRSSRPGLSAGTWLALTGLQFWWLHGLRTDPAPLWAGLRPDLWASGALFAAGLLIFFYAGVRKTPAISQEPSSS